MALNVTAVNPTAASYLTLYPAGAVRPPTWNLNLTRSQILPDLVIVAVGADRKATFYNRAGTVDVTADLAGYF